MTWKVARGGKIKPGVEATRQQNGQNRGLSRNNKSGVKGVRYCGTRAKWEAWAGSGKRLGRFATMEEAVAARSAFEAHEHGEYRRVVSSAT